MIYVSSVKCMIRVLSHWMKMAILDMFRNLQVVGNQQTSRLFDFARPGGKGNTINKSFNIQSNTHKYVATHAAVAFSKMPTFLRMFMFWWTQPISKRTRFGDLKARTTNTTWECSALSDGTGLSLMIFPGRRTVREYVLSWRPCIRWWGLILKYFVHVLLLFILYKILLVGGDFNIFGNFTPNLGDS